MQDLASFEVGQRVKARVLAVDVGAKTVALSLLRHLVAFSSSCQLPQVPVACYPALRQTWLSIPAFHNQLTNPPLPWWLSALAGGDSPVSIAATVC